MNRRKKHTTKQQGFSLIELIVAAAVSAVMMGAVLLILGTFGRDRRRLNAEDARPRHKALVELLRRDLSNSETMSIPSSGRVIILSGHAGIDSRSLSLTGRLTRVTYEMRGDRGASVLVRHQEYLDDPIHRDPWIELVSPAVSRISFEPVGTDDSSPAEVTIDPPVTENPASPKSPRRSAIVRQIPAKVRVRLDWFNGSSIDELLWLK